MNEPFIDMNEPFINMNEPFIDMNEPFIDMKEPFIDMKEALFDMKEALFDMKEPLFDMKEPLFDMKEPLFDMKEPLFDMKEPLFDMKEPLFDMKEPLFDMKEPLFDMKEPLFDMNEPFIDMNEPFIDMNEPFIDMNEPFIDMNEPFIDMNEPFIDMNEPFIDMNEPFIDMNEPFIDMNEPFIDMNEPFIEEKEALIDKKEAATLPRTAGLPLFRSRVTAYPPRMPPGPASSQLSSPIQLEQQRLGAFQALLGALGAALIRLWLRLFGRTVDLADAPWLAGPIGPGDGAIGDRPYALVAAQEKLTVDREPGKAGLLSDFGVLDGPSFDLARVDPEVRRFYEETSLYHLEVWSHAPFPARLFLWLLVSTVSRTMNQLNFPVTGMELARGMTSEVIPMRDAAGKTIYTGWLRRTVGTGRIVYTGFYTSEKPGKRTGWR